MQTNLKELKRRCQMETKEYWKLGKTSVTKDGCYTYIDNGAPVLAVAHLDTVLDSKHFDHMVLNGDHVVFSTALDDRLGAYIILDYLPKLLGKGQYDILLTEGEERGRSTAAWFEATHDYNWMFQFDRAGTDVVLYQYDSVANRELLKKHKFVPSWGSFSDICSLDHLECSGFNFGCGYEDNHSKYSHMEIKDTEMMVRNFVPFFKEFKEIYIPIPTAKEQIGYHHAYSLPYTLPKANTTAVEPTLDWQIDEKGHWYQGESQWNKSYYKNKYEIGDCVNCSAYGVDTDENGLCDKCAKSFDQALNNSGLSYATCQVCQEYGLCDSSGICSDCAEWLDTGNPT